MNSSLQTETAALPAGILNAFEPSAERVRFLDQRMRSRLADSLRYILSEANGLLDVPQNPFQEFLSGLERGPVSPLAFSHYNDIVFAIEEDDLGEASRLFGELISLPAAEQADMMKTFASVGIDVSKPKPLSGSDASKTKPESVGFASTPSHRPLSAPPLRGPVA